MHALVAQLKAPIVSIRGFLGLIERDLGEGNVERLRSDLARVGAAANRMYLMINGLLEISNIGRHPNSPDDVPFEEIAMAGLSTVEASLGELKAQVHIQPDMPSVHVDLTRTIEVVQHLIENAIKNMGEQPDPQIKIGVRTDDGRQVFFVSDNGIGIEPDFHDRVFNIFEKLDPQSEGTGIGLAVVKRIIEIHGGKIWVESDGLGKGSVFYFTLPQK